MIESQGYSEELITKNAFEMATTVGEALRNIKKGREEVTEMKYRRFSRDEII